MAKPRPMTLLTSLLAFFLLVVSSLSYSCPPALHKSQPASLHMISSIISRGQGISSSGLSTSQIELGIFQAALRYARIQYPDCSQYLSAILDQSLSSVVFILENVTTDAHYPLDRFSIGNALFYVQSEDKNLSDQRIYTDTVTDLLLSRIKQPRNYLGGFWYYAAYPNWSYLDGMFSIAPFTAHSVALEASNITDTAMLDDIVLQFSLLYSHGLHHNTSLLVHGYDASETASWADKITGASPNVWGRSLGWYLTGLVETLDLMTPYKSSWQYRELLGIYITLSGAVMSTADPASGAWWQMMEYSDSSGNYLESSATNLFIYALLKGVRMGLLVDPKAANYTIGALKAYSYTVGNLVKPNINGTLDWNAAVSVCSLNSSATYDYYVTRPILWDSLIGTSAFVLASLEVEQLSMAP